jgi:CspA family cold shock protein|tara:strand:+ start:129 stop:350 length:222 start_codon:yes stop_codon:yes gene_type:complete
MLGKIKWFDSFKRYGFILPSEGGKDVFAHEKEFANIESTKELTEGLQVQYDIGDNNGKTCAVNIKVLPVDIAE